MSPVKLLAWALLVLYIPCAANAVLIDRGQGFIYDDVLGITWTQNANIDGFIKTWYERTTWVQGLNLTHDGTVYDDWRLPNMDVDGDRTLVSCLTATEIECRDNELGYMTIQHGVTPTTPDLFTNVGYLYWSSTDYDADGRSCNAGPEGNCAWRHSHLGGHNYVSKSYSGYGGWAVRDGDVSVSEPSTLGLLGAGLIGLGFMRRKTSKG